MPDENGYTTADDLNGGSGPALQPIDRNPVAEHIPTIHLEPGGTLRWTCSCGVQSLNRRWDRVDDALTHWSREHLYRELRDEVAALRAERDGLDDENSRWKASYNDLVGRIPKHQLDSINRAREPHWREFPNHVTEYGAMKRKVESMEPVVEALLTAANHPRCGFNDVHPCDGACADAVDRALDAYRASEEEATDAK